MKAKMWAMPNMSWQQYSRALSRTTRSQFSNSGPWYGHGYPSWGQWFGTIKPKTTNIWIDSRTYRIQLTEFIVSDCPPGAYLCQLEGNLNASETKRRDVLNTYLLAIQVPTKHCALLHLSHSARRIALLNVQMILCRIILKHFGQRRARRKEYEPGYC